MAQRIRDSSLCWLTRMADVVLNSTANHKANTAIRKTLSTLNLHLLKNSAASRLRAIMADGNPCLGPSGLLALGLSAIP